MLRKSVVAGSFYPDDPQMLKTELQGYTAATKDKAQAFGLVVPHAGYVYSGAIAARGYQTLDIPAKVLLLGPNHRGLGPQASLYTKGAWQTPLGQVPIAETLAAQLLADCDLLEADTLAHQFEHSIEVQLPFLQMLRPDLSIVPISLGHGRLEEWQQLGRQIGQVLEQTDEPVLLVASSDMNHFAGAEAGRRVDELAIARMESYDPAGLYQIVQQEKISMCGVVPAVVMLEAARVLGGSSCRLLHYGHSGEVNGDLSSVVGYATLIVT